MRRPLFASLFLCLSVEAMAQQTPLHTVPIGRGAGIGFNNAPPVPAGCFLSKDAATDPAFKACPANILSFGAVAGSSSAGSISANTAAFAAAFTASPSVYCPDGQTFYVSNILPPTTARALSGHCTLIASGTLTPTHGLILIDGNTGGMVVEDVTIQVDTTANPTVSGVHLNNAQFVTVRNTNLGGLYGVLISSGANITVKDNVISGYLGRGVYANTAVSGLTISNNLVGSGTAASTTGIAVINGTFVHVCGNTVLQTKGFGIAQSGGGNVTICDNLTYDTQAEGVHVDGVNVGLLTGNVVAFAGASADVGISVSNDAGVSSLQVQVIGNSIHSPFGTGIYFVGCQRCAAIANRIQNANVSGGTLSASIILDNTVASPTDQITIMGNTIYNDLGSAQYMVGEGSYTGAAGPAATNYIGPQIGTPGTLGKVLYSEAATVGWPAIALGFDLLTTNDTFWATGSRTVTKGVLPVPSGGLGIGAGSSGGIPYFNAPTTIASTSTLIQNQLILGGGAGGAPASLGSLGTTTTVLHGNAVGGPSFGPVVLNTDVSNVLQVVNGGTNCSVASGTCLDNITAFSSTGLIARTGAGAYAFRTLTAPAAGITVSNGSGVVGNPTLALANDLLALEALAGTGLAVRTTTDTWAQRSVAGGTGITVTNGDGVSGNPSIAITNTITAGGPTGSSSVVPVITYNAQGQLTTVTTATITAAAIGAQPSDSDLDALAANTTNGLWARTGTGTGVARTITGTANEITLTNGDGVSGNPVVSIPSAVTFTGKTITGGGFTGGTLNNATVGATTASTGAFTTLTASGTATFSGFTTINRGSSAFSTGVEPKVTGSGGEVGYGHVNTGTGGKDWYLISTANATGILCAGGGFVFYSNVDAAQRGCFNSNGAFILGNVGLTAVAAELGMAKIAASGSAPGASGAKLAVVCGTGAGTAKLIMYAGTSTTPVTVADNVGTGVSGC